MHWELELETGNICTLAAIGRGNVASVQCCRLSVLPMANGIAEKGAAKRRVGAGGGESDEDAVQGFGSQANRTPVPSGDEE